jgi:hypothetical protein
MIFCAISYFVTCQNSGPCPNDFQTPFVLLGKKKMELLNVRHFMEDKTEVMHHDLKMQ